MKPTLLTIALLLAASTAQAQGFRSYGYGDNPVIYSRSWSYSVSTFGPYGNYGGYGYGFPRYQLYVPQQQFYPGYQGTIPGLYSNGYFVPGW